MIEIDQEVFKRTPLFVYKCDIIFSDLCPKLTEREIDMAMNYQEYQGDEYRGQILSWFETDFKETAKSTTKTQRLDDGKVSYKFSAVNNTGYNFDRFSFKVKILNKANGQEIGTATIRTGEWKVGETKNFRSKIAIPPDVRSISFVMYS